MNEVAELELPTQEIVHADLRTLCRGAIRVALEVVLEEEIQDLVGARKWARQAQRVDSRNGTYLRRLITSMGAIDLKVPRSREGGSAGSRVFDRYKRRSAEVDDTMVAAYVSLPRSRGHLRCGGDWIHGEETAAEVHSRVQG
jgi:transposase-like protein